jgi:propionyl-CoA:succinyl-CoA transferase
MNELTGADFKSATADDNKKLFIETYGCQMNVADSEVIASVMQMAGYSVAETLEEADAVFMNTCSIRDNAEQKILNRLEFFHSMKKKKKHLIVGVLGCMAERVKAIRYRAPYTTNPDFRKAVNNGEIAYNDIHLSQMAQEVRYGFMGKVNVAIIEACEVTPDGKIYLTAAGGIAPTVCRLADQIIVELNSAHSKNMMGMHDVYEPLDPPYRREIPIYKPSDRIGLPYIQVDPKKIVGIVETNWPDEARSFAAADPITDKIGQNVADFLAADMKRGIIPSTFLPLQSGVGNIANAVLGALGRDQTIPAFEMYTEVIQNSVIGLIREGRVKFGSACSLTVTNDCLQGIYDDMDFFRDKLILRPSEISNSPEVVRRLGIISINTAIEADIYGNVRGTIADGFYT